MSYVVLGFCFDEIIVTLYEYVMLWFNWSGEISVIMLFTTCYQYRTFYMTMSNAAQSAFSYGKFCVIGNIVVC